MLPIRNVDSTNPVSEKHISGTCLRISSWLYNCFNSTCSEGSPKARLYWHDSPTCCCSMRFMYCKGRSRSRFAVAAGNWKTWRIPVFCDTKRHHRVIPFPTPTPTPSLHWIDEMSENNEHSFGNFGPWRWRHYVTSTSGFPLCAGAASYARRSEFSGTPLWEPQNLTNVTVCCVMRRFLWSTG